MYLPILQSGLLNCCAYTFQTGGRRCENRASSAMKMRPGVQHRTRLPQQRYSPVLCVAAGKNPPQAAAHFPHSFSDLHCFCLRSWVLINAHPLRPLTSEPSLAALCIKSAVCVCVYSAKNVRRRRANSGRKLKYVCYFSVEMVCIVKYHVAVN